MYVKSAPFVIEVIHIGISELYNGAHLFRSGLVLQE